MPPKEIILLHRTHTGGPTAIDPPASLKKNMIVVNFGQRTDRRTTNKNQGTMVTNAKWHNYINFGQFTESFGMYHLRYVGKVWFEALTKISIIDDK